MKNKVGGTIMDFSEYPINPKLVKNQKIYIRISDFSFSIQMFLKVNIKEDSIYYFLATSDNGKNIYLKETLEKEKNTNIEINIESVGQMIDINEKKDLENIINSEFDARSLTFFFLLLFEELKNFKIRRISLTHKKKNEIIRNTEKKFPIFAKILSLNKDRVEQISLIKKALV